MNDTSQIPVAGDSVEAYDPDLNSDENDDVTGDHLFETASCRDRSFSKGSLASEVHSARSGFGSRTSTATAMSSLPPSLGLRWNPKDDSKKVSHELLASPSIT